MEYCCRAVKEGRVDIVEWFIEQGLDINDPIESKSSPGYETYLLDIAIIHQHVDVVASLLNAGANPNPPVEKCYQPPFWLAMRRKSKEITLLLLRYGADIHQRSRDGENPFRSIDLLGTIAISRLMNFLGYEFETEVTATKSQLLSFYLGVRDEESLVRHLPVDTIHKHVFPKCLHHSYAKGSILTPKQRNDAIDIYINSGAYRVALQWPYRIRRSITDPENAPYLGPTPLWCLWNDPSTESDAPPAKKRTRDSHTET